MEDFFAMEQRQISIESITIGDEIQQRVSLNQECIEEYAEEIRKGTRFPALAVFFDGERYLLADGLHRLLAYKQAGVTTVEVIVHEGGVREATLYAAGANSDHGLRRTNADKRKAVTTLLFDKEWTSWSDAAIAEQCRVSSAFVGKLRNEMTLNGLESSPIRIGKDGRTIDTSNIGSRAESGGQNEPQGVTVEGASEPSAEDSRTVVAAGDNVPQSSDEVQSGDDQETSAEITEEQVEIPTSEDDVRGSEGEPSIEEASESREAEFYSDPDPLIDDQDGNESVDSEEVDPQEQRIRELESLVEAKDQRIKELEEENEYLWLQIQAYEKDYMSPTIADQEGTHMEQIAS